MSLSVNEYRGKVTPSMCISISEYERFARQWQNNAEDRKHLRFGQAFYNYFHLHKHDESRDGGYFDKLYNEPDHGEATHMILALIDWSN